MTSTSANQTLGSHHDQALIPFPSICCISAQPIQQGPKPKNPSFAYHHCSYGSGKYRGVNYSDIKHITQRLESSNFRIFWDISCPGFECQMSWGSVKPCPLAWPATYTLIPKVGWLGKKTQTITTMLYVLSCFGAMTKIMYTDVLFIG